MSQINADQILAQMRVMAAQAGTPAATPVQTEGNGADFSELLANSINKVNETQQQASDLAEAFETGAENVDLAQVMVALQKANVSFQAMLQVRNKLVEAYKDVMNMPV